ncbi:hypothetical protein [Oxalobacter aliiformigenes]|uniref:hypothetical protein n=1 Tax=Oxalobacter aliiformigenes TaxID=2946593 RepID=UPI0022AE60FA|nr:hypothetical protein [Oxalobacter aliiformigenes]WAV93373.1 hypothetical protein NB641_01025 [Oxalobacter aliiformigenes]
MGAYERFQDKRKKIFFLCPKTQKSAIGGDLPVFCHRMIGFFFEKGDDMSGLILSVPA